LPQTLVCCVGMKMLLPSAFSCAVLLCLVVAVAVPSIPSVLAQQTTSSTELKYQAPPEVMVKLVDAPPTPTINLSPTHGTGPRRILIQQFSSLPTIADLAEPHSPPALSCSMSYRLSAQRARIS